MKPGRPSSEESTMKATPAPEDVVLGRKSNLMSFI
jgi:hypothetical protein